MTAVNYDLLFKFLILLLIIHEVISDGSCESGKEFNCYDRKCCDGTEYCSEADQFCRQCIPENCYGFDIETMCKDYCNVQFPSTTVHASYITHNLTTNHQVKESKAQWLPETNEQIGFLIIIVLCTILFNICLLILWKCGKKHSRVKRVTLPAFSSKTRVNVFQKTEEDAISRDSGIESPSVFRRGSQTALITEYEKPTEVKKPTVCSPQNDRTIPHEKGIMVISGN